VVPEDAVVVVASPHGTGSFVYARPSGSLAGFGFAGVDVDIPIAIEHVDPIFDWEVVENGPLDHGAVVALHLLAIAQPTIAVSVTGDASGLARAIEKVAATRSTFVICSAHTSACLTERAPVPYSIDAIRLDARFITEVESDCGVARDLAPEFETIGASCSRSTLQLFGELFAGTPGKVQAYGAPAGVGYPVVTVARDV
jgi:hypothetical protein